MTWKQLRVGFVGVLVIAVVQAAALADANSSDPALDVATGFSLSAVAQDNGSSTWDVEGPVSMRSADTQERGTIDLKIGFDYGTSSDGTDDDYGNSFELQWGLADNHEIRLMLPINFGDGEDGNADLSFGWQWRLWEEQNALPAFAVYNELRIPSGYHSSGLDWELRGVMTWTLQPDSMRLHFNPFIRFMDGDNLESNLHGDGDDHGFFFDNDHHSARHFAAGGIIGIDYRFSDTTVLNVDYVLDSGRMNGYSMQHSMEAGLDYDLGNGQSLTWATRWTLDGDSQGDNWGMTISYIISCDDWGRPKLSWEN